MNEILPSPQISKEIRHQNWWRKNPGFSEELRRSPAVSGQNTPPWFVKLGLESGFLHTALKFNIAFKNRQSQKETHFPTIICAMLNFGGVHPMQAWADLVVPGGFSFCFHPRSLIFSRNGWRGGKVFLQRHCMWLKTNIHEGWCRDVGCIHVIYVYVW